MYIKTRTTNTISTTIVNEHPLVPRAPPTAAPAPRAPPAVVQQEAPLWATKETGESIKNWLLNLNENGVWFHPVSISQYKNFHDGQVLNFKFIGDSSKDCKVVVVEKLPLEEYDLLKKTTTVGPFSAEADFPWNKYKETKTCLIRVKRI
jgi:hypothetical protein